MIETRQIRYFQAVAETLNFSRAAVAEHVTQATLSEQISRLEQFIGVKLFERTTRRVTLTPAGAAFLSATKGVLGTIDAATNSARNAAAGITGTLIVGFQWNTYPWIALARRTFEWEHPAVKVIYRQSAFGDPTGGLSVVDVAFVTPPFEDQDVVDVTVLAEDQRILIVSSTHPWASRGAVDLAEVLTQPLVTLATRDRWCRAFWELDSERGFGVAPSDPEPVTIEEWIAEIERGKAVSIAPQVAWDTYARSSLARVDIHGITPATTAIATTTPNSPMVTEFIKTVVRLASNGSSSD
jgi:DNA-binding transcriptional LysR family regulator